MHDEQGKNSDARVVQYSALADSATRGGYAVIAASFGVCVAAIVDVKCPGSGEAARMHWPNLETLGRFHEVKFVIADRTELNTNPTTHTDVRRSEECSRRILD